MKLFFEQTNFLQFLPVIILNKFNVIIIIIIYNLPAFVIRINSSQCDSDVTQGSVLYPYSASMLSTGSLPARNESR